MVKLETVEDFEKVKKALENSKSVPREYCICPFSYCEICREVTEFEAPFEPGSCINVKCQHCGCFFVVYDNDSISQILWGFKRTEGVKRMPEAYGTEMRKLNSREMQKKFFAVELERRITREKRELRKTQDKIQQFAGLRY